TVSATVAITTAAIAVATAAVAVAAAVTTALAAVPAAVTVSATVAITTAAIAVATAVATIAPIAAVPAIVCYGGRRHIQMSFRIDADREDGKHRETGGGEGDKAHGEPF
ncbi:MAG: hypothetical protein AAFP17_17000, partial [Pseudomonadota bacterium]